MPRETLEAFQDHGEVARLARAGRRRRAPHARGVRGGGDRLRRRRRRRSSARAWRSSPSRSSSCSPTSRPSATRWWPHEPRHRAHARAGPAAARGLRPLQRRGGLGPPHLVDVGRRPDGRPARGRLPAHGHGQPAQPGQRPPDLLQGPRLAALLRGAQGGGDHRRRRAAHLPQARLAPGGPPDAAHPADRRGDRLARPGPADRGRRGARGQAARPAPLPRVVPVRRLRDGRGLDLGGVRARRVQRARQPHGDHRRQPARPDARDDGRLGPRRATRARAEAFGWHAIEIDGHDVDAIAAAYDEARRPRPAGRP